LPKRLHGKTVLVLGADGNLGPTWVRALLEEGAIVWGLGLRATTDSSLSSIRADRGALSLGNLDISEEIGSLQIEEALGFSLEENALDGVVMNAGIDSVPGQGREKITDYDRGEWLRIFDVNLFGIIDTLNAVVPSLADPSAVVVMGSLYGLVAPNPHLMNHFNRGKGQIKHPAYGASKAALVAAARHYGTTLASRGVRVNALTPGGVAAGQDAEFVKKFSALTPQGRMQSREEMIGAMVFLLCDDSRAMTGQNVVIDGGFTAW